MTHLFPVKMDVTRAEEPPVAGRATVRVLRQQVVKEPLFEPFSS